MTEAPIYIALDISFAVCNAQCQWCAVPLSKFPKKFLSLEESATIANLNDNLDIGLVGFGEPMVNPHFYDIVKVLHNKFNMSYLFTNFSVDIPEEKMNFLLDVFDRIVINVGGSDSALRSSNMKIPQDHFEQNMNTLQSIGDRGKVYYSLLPSKGNHEHHSYAKTPLMIYSKEYFNMLTYRDYDSYIKDVYDGSIFNDLSFEKTNCTDFNQNLRVNADGRIYSCCFIYHNESASIGNAFIESIESVVDRKMDMNNLYCKNCVISTKHNR